MHAKRPLALLLGAAGASMSAGASLRYLGDDPSAAPNPDAQTPQASATPPTTTTTIAGHKRPHLTALATPTAALSKKELGLDQSLARDVACWISAASVYAARQAFYASALPLPLGPGTESSVATAKRVLTAPDAIISISSSSTTTTTAHSHALIENSSPAGVYHKLFGWLHELTPTAAHWDAQRVIQSSSFTILLNAISNAPQSSPLAVREELERELFRAVGALATNAQCAREIAERSTRYGKRALLNLAQRHDDDPRVGAALRRLVLLDDAAGCSFGPAHLVSLLSLAVAPPHDVPDEYLEFALWALRRAASPHTQKPLKYAWRKALFGSDASAATKRKLLANDALWTALLANGAMHRSESVQLQAAQLLSELIDSDDPHSARALQRHDPQRVLLQWLQSPSVPLACAALDVVANAACADESLRAALLAGGALDVLRVRLVADSDCRLTARLLRAVHCIARVPVADSSAEVFALDAHALSFADNDADDSDADDLHPLHSDDFVTPGALVKRTSGAADGWIELLTTHVRSSDPHVRAQAATCLELLASTGTHCAQTQLEWLHAVLDAALEAVPRELTLTSASVRLARRRTRPVAGRAPEPQATYDVALAQALRALAHVTDQRECQLALERLGGVALLTLLLASDDVAVQRETARVVANILASATPLPAAVQEFAATRNSPLERALGLWTQSRDLQLQALAHRARANRRRHIPECAGSSSYSNSTANGTVSDAQHSVTYLDGVHPLHLPASMTQSDANENAYDVDVVFLHGLLGCPFETWMCGDDEQSVWAHAWLLEDLARAGRSPRVLSVGYDSQLLAGDSAWRTLGFQCTSDAIAHKLAAARVGGDNRPVVFVTHSLGGVLLKQVLHDSAAGTSDPLSHASDHASDLSDVAPRLVDSVRGVVFYGVPHHGSPVAQTIRALRPQSLGLAQHPVTEHLHGSAHSEMLNESCAALFAARGIAALSVGETLPCRLPVVGFETLVVPSESANPGFGRFVAVSNTTHMSVCKPSSQDDERYRLAKDFIVECAAPHASKAAVLEHAFES